MTLVICKRCRLEKDKSLFYPAKRNKTRLHNYCIPCCKIINKEYLEKNKNKRQEYLERSKEHRREWNRQYKRIRRQTNIEYKLMDNLRRRMRKALTHSYKTSSASKELGCSIQELKQYLESLFQPGMTWNNYGEWHIDHIIPLSSVDLTDREQLLKVWNYTNLQPLWKNDNLQKRDKLIW